MKNKKQKYCDPSACNECIYIGEGDFLCEKFQEIVISDWQPTNEFLTCINENRNRIKGGKP